PASGPAAVAGHVLAACSGPAAAAVAGRDLPAGSGLAVAVVAGRAVAAGSGPAAAVVAVEHAAVPAWLARACSVAGRDGLSFRPAAPARRQERRFRQAEE